MIGGGAIKITLEGSSMRVSARLKNPDGTYVAPAQVRLVVKPPSSADSFVYASSAIGDARVGVIEADEPGTWRYRFESLANPLAAYERLFFVMRRRVPAPIPAPYIIGGQNFTFSETVPIGTLIMTVAVGGGAATGFAVTGGNPGDAFVINNLGQLRTAAALSAAALNFYNLQVTASNRAGVSPAVGIALTLTAITPQVVVATGFEAVGAVGALITNTGALVVPAGVAGAGAFGTTGSGLPAPRGSFLSEDGNFYFVSEDGNYYFAQESIGFAGLIGVSGAMTGGTVAIVLPGDVLAQPAGVVTTGAVGAVQITTNAVFALSGVAGGGAVGDPVVVTGALPLDSLDVSTEVLGAWGLRKLRTAYAGQCIRVRRSSDSTEQDIGFSGNLLDTAALATFVGAGDGYVITEYEQSGSGASDMIMPYDTGAIVIAGVLQTVGGKPAYKITDTAHNANAASVALGASAAKACLIKLHRPTSLATGRRLGAFTTGGIDSDSDARGIFSYIDTATPTAYRNGSARSVGSALSVDTDYVVSSNYDGTNSQIHVNGTAGTSVASTGSFTTPAEFKSNAGSDAANLGYYGEEYMLGNVNSGDRAVLETAIRTHYGF